MRGPTQVKSKEREKQACQAQNDLIFGQNRKQYKPETLDSSFRIRYTCYSALSL